MLTLTTLLLAPLSVPQQDETAYAPPAREVDGLLATPIDIRSLEASAVFDVEKREASARAKMTFRMTGDGGNALFDLRQRTVSKAWINGQEIDPSALAAHDFGGGCGTMRILEGELPPGEDHVLELEYPLGQPASPQSIPIGWGDGRLSWDFWMSDLNHGRYLEAWFPCNLIYDSFPFEFDFQVTGLTEPHELVTNATEEKLGDNHWKLSYPETFTALSHMLVFVPAEEVERSVEEIKLSDGREVTVDVCRRLDAASDLAGTHAHIARDLEAFTENTGPWPHGNSFVAYIWTGGRSMEYDGSTTSSMGALSHEIYHSWYGRGVRPASQNDGWIDEAWTVFMTSSRRRPPNFQDDDPPVTLSSADPYNRITPGISYSLGTALFMRIGNVIGRDELIDSMAEFFTKTSPGVMSTADLAEHLVKAAGKDGEKVRRIFDRWAYGKE